LPTGPYALTMNHANRVTVLVTGATGFAAGHCIVDLLAHGYNVRGTVRNLATANTAHLREAIDHASGTFELAMATLDAARLDPAPAPPVDPRHGRVPDQRGHRPAEKTRVNRVIRIYPPQSGIPVYFDSSISRERALVPELCEDGLVEA
jgi:hypothetical protein